MMRALRYLPIDLVARGACDLARVEVRSSLEGDALGSIEGFVVDTETGHLRWVVVDCGAWFAGDSYMLPPTFTRLAPAEGVLWIHATRRSLRRFPRFDALEIDELAGDLVGTYEQRIRTSYASGSGPAAHLSTGPNAPHS
jgi:hypothetical protein